MAAFKIKLLRGPNKIFCVEGSRITKRGLWACFSEKSKKGENFSSARSTGLMPLVATDRPPFFSCRFVVCRFCTGWRLLDIKGDTKSILFSSQE